MNVAVGLAEKRPAFRIALEGDFKSVSGELFPRGDYEFNEPIALNPSNPDAGSFVVDGVTIGIGFHWQRDQRQAFRGGFRVVPADGGLTLVNDVDLDAYVESVIASEMNADSPMELLKTHAVISRSWLVSQMRSSGGTHRTERQIGTAEWEILGWYGRESHEQFDVCADDHCQRYQGLVGRGAAADNARRAVVETAREFVVFEGEVCDARFSKCCGGVTEDYRAAWEDIEVPYLTAVNDGCGTMPVVDDQWIRQRPEAYCNMDDPVVLSRILPGFDQETPDFYRWEVTYASDELAELVREQTGIELGGNLRFEPLERGASGRIIKLRIAGSSGSLNIGKELEIRRVLSPSHLYSSAFVVDSGPGRVRLLGAGWGHGVGLCQIGAGVMATGGASYTEILSHYYPGAGVEMRRERQAD